MFATYARAIYLFSVYIIEIKSLIVYVFGVAHLV